MERTLSSNEAKIVLDLEWRGRKSVTLEDLRAALGSSESYSRYVAHRLVRKGWLERLRPGLFQLIPADRGLMAVPDSNPLAVGAVLVRPYFYSFGTACTHHGLTEQVFATVYLACRQHRGPETIRATRYVFAYVRDAHFFGFEEANVLGETVQMATRERALLDALDRPHYAGGLSEVFRMVGRSAARLSWERLVEMLERRGESAVAQRLGCAVDLQGVELSQEVRRRLERLVRPKSKILLGPRARWGTSGKLCRPWNVVLNVPRRVLVEKGDQRGRRVRFDVEARHDG